MIKLKDIIEEIKKGTKLPVFPISRQEENEAFQYIKRVLVPDWVKKTNHHYKDDILDVDTVNKLLKKEKIYERQGIITGVLFTTDSNPEKSYWFLVKKNRKGRLIVQNPNGNTWDVHAGKQLF